MGKWKKTGSEYVLQSRWLSLRKDAYDTPEGKRINDFYVLERRDFIVLVPMTTDGKYIFVSQYRHGVEAETLNFPKGMIEESEDPIEAALRELTEETGYIGSSAEFLGSYQVSPALMKTKGHIFLVKDVVLSEQGSVSLDTDEINSVNLLTEPEIESKIDSQELNDIFSVAGYLLAKRAMRR